MKGGNAGNGTLLLLAAVGAVAVLAACTPKEVKISSSSAANAGAVNISTAPPVNVEEASLRGGEFVGVPEVRSAYFAFDKAELTVAARSVLRANADYLKQHPELDVEVSGNCDERGTVEYNLALGQRRAKAVRDYYMLLGVPGERIATISYGKEKPVCTEHSEACWAKNRRADTQVRQRPDSGSSAIPAAAPLGQ